MLMAVFEGRALERRPQSPTEVAARPPRSSKEDDIGFFPGGLGRIIIYVSPIETDGFEALQQEFPRASIEGLLHIEEHEEGLKVLLLYHILDKLESHDILRDESVGDEAILVARDKLDDRLVHADTVRMRMSIL